MKICFILLSLLTLACVPGAAAAVKKARVAGLASERDRYVKLARGGASPVERSAALDRILSKYDYPSGRQILDQLYTERNYLKSWLWYMEQKSKGMTVEKRFEAAGRMLAKYKGKAVEVSYAESEYKYLKGILDTRMGQTLLQPATPQALLQAPTMQARAEPLQQPATHEVLLSTPQAAAPFPAHPKKKAEEKPPKYFGLAGFMFGSYGLAGYEGIINFGRNISVSYGEGSGAPDGVFLDSHYSLSQASSLFLFRYGGRLYLGTGIKRVSRTGTCSSGPFRSRVSITNTSMPLAVGFESSQRGLFFAARAEYSVYYGDSSVTLTAEDPKTGDRQEFLLEPPVNGIAVGVGFGVYFF